MPAAWSGTRTSCSTAWRSDSRTSGSGTAASAREQRVADVASGGGGQAEQVLGRGVEPGDALQQQVAQAARQLAGLAVAGGEELLGEEGVAFGAGHDGVGHRGWHGRAGGEQRRQLPGRERAEFEHEARARAPHAVGEPAHAPRRGGLVPAVGGEQYHRSFGQVVGEEHDQVERRRIGPVQVLEHEQHRRGGRVTGEERERLLEDPQLGTCGVASVGRGPPSGRSASANGW